MNESERSFVCGYLAAVAQVARWNGLKASDLLANANITRDLAVQSNVGEYEMQILDREAAWAK